eukprot:1535385-Rhodomonas_salina.1
MMTMMTMMKKSRKNLKITPVSHLAIATTRVYASLRAVGSTPNRGIPSTKGPVQSVRRAWAKAVDLAAEITARLRPLKARESQWYCPLSSYDIVLRAPYAMSCTTVRYHPTCSLRNVLYWYKLSSYALLRNVWYRQSISPYTLLFPVLAEPIILRTRGANS